MVIGIKIVSIVIIKCRELRLIVFGFSIIKNIM